MGAFTSRRNAGVEEIDYSTTNAYRYPPKSGCYFGSYFIMGGERFDTTQPEAYLFGENPDLNFLGNRPVPFPYPAPQANEPTKTLKSLVNIRKDSLRFIKVSNEGGLKLKEEGKEGEEQPESARYNIEFTFDTDVRVAITIYYFATEEITNGQALYHPRDASMNSETYHYKRGANQTFSQSTHIIDPCKFPEEEWQFNPDKEVIPVVIQCVVEDEIEHVGHSHMTFGIVEKLSEGYFALKPLKQKQMVDGLCYLLQEIYGIENKNTERGKEDEIEDSGSECVICMSDIRDTLILPCRHLCLCNGCADSLRYQANNCPICRAPFRALLQIRAMRKKLPNAPPMQQSDPEENPLSQEGVPPGYEAVSLIEALNGPNTIPPPPTVVPQEMMPVPPLLPPGQSLPTSPEESPLMDKRKPKSRQGSVRSKRSLIGSAVLEEGEEAMEEIETVERQPTPEIVMTESRPDPVKTDEQPMPKINPFFKKQKRDKQKGRSPPPPVGAAVAIPSQGAGDSAVQIINEIEANMPVGAECASEVLEGAEAVALVAGGDASSQEAPLSPQYEQATQPGPLGKAPVSAEIAYPEVTFQPHTAVMYGQEEGTGEQGAESEPLCLPSQVMDNMSLPGTPASTTDGSSFSSSSSSRNLLAQNTGDGTSPPSKPSSEDDKAMSKWDRRAAEGNPENC